MLFGGGRLPVWRNERREKSVYFDKDEGICEIASKGDENRKRKDEIDKECIQKYERIREAEE